MRIRLWHIVFFLAALAVFAIARAPASVFAPQRPGVFTYERAQGSVWRARFEQVSLGPYQVGALDWRLSFWGLLQGKAEANLNFADGAIEGDVALAANLGGNRRISAPSLRVDGAQVGALTLDGTSSAQGLDIVFEGGRCVSATGAVQSDILARNEASLRWRGPPMSGAAGCEGADALIAMTGSGDNESARLALRLRGDGGAQWRAELSGARPDVTAVLASAGFEADPASGASIVGGEVRWIPF